MKPSFELYGDWLLTQERADEAISQFDYSLQRAPKRILSLKGKLAAAKALGNEELEAEIQKLLDEAHQNKEKLATSQAL